MKNKQLNIGISGVARSGKNLFGDILIKQLKLKYNINTMQFGVADELKKECAQFIKDKLNLNVFSEYTPDKNEFRDMLIWYGNVMRTRTKGRHWIEKLELNIGKEYEWGTTFETGLDAAIITDIRYCTYEKDELHWIKNELNGILIHVEKYDRNGKIHPPANIHECKNDPIIKENADYLLQWEDISCDNNLSMNELLDNEYLNNRVIQCLDNLIYSKTIQLE
jgi:hypothetical protein